MMFWSHQVVAVSGFLAYADVATKGQFELSGSFWLALALIMVGAALPDIDTPDSTLGKRLTFLSYPISTIFGHRGITHSVLTLVGLYALGVYLDWPWMFWLVVGVGLHLVGDFLTDSGVPLLWPMRQRFRFVLVGSTNSVTEPLMVTLFVAGCITLGFVY